MTLHIRLPRGFRPRRDRGTADSRTAPRPLVTLSTRSHSSSDSFTSEDPRATFILCAWPPRRPVRDPAGPRVRTAGPRHAPRDVHAPASIPDQRLAFRTNFWMIVHAPSNMTAHTTAMNSHSRTPNTHPIAVKSPPRSTRNGLARGRRAGCDPRNMAGRTQSETLLGRRSPCDTRCSERIPRPPTLFELDKAVPALEPGTAGGPNRRVVAQAIGEAIATRLSLSDLHRLDRIADLFAGHHDCGRVVITFKKTRSRASRTTALHQSWPRRATLGTYGNTAPATLPC